MTDAHRRTPQETPDLRKGDTPWEEATRKPRRRSGRLEGELRQQRHAPRLWRAGRRTPRRRPHHATGGCASRGGRMTGLSNSCWSTYGGVLLLHGPSRQDGEDESRRRARRYAATRACADASASSHRGVKPPWRGRVLARPPPPPSAEAASVHPLHVLWTSASRGGGIHLAPQ